MGHTLSSQRDPIYAAEKQRSKNKKKRKVLVELFAFLQWKSGCPAVSPILLS
jgi:hypothetical protein